MNTSNGKEAHELSPEKLLARYQTAVLEAHLNLNSDCEGAPQRATNCVTERDYLYDVLLNRLNDKKETEKPE